MNDTQNAPDLCQKPTDPWFIVYTIFLVIILLGTLFGNGLVVLAVFMFSRLRRVSNFFIVSLAISDLLVALMTLPLRIDQATHNNNWCLPATVCVFWASTDNIWSAASILNLAIISIDRFLAITKPFVYQEKMTKKVCIILIAVVWCYACTWGFLSLINWTTWDNSLNWIIKSPGTGETNCGKDDKVYYTSVFVCAFVLPLLIIIITYISIFKVALQQSKNMEAHDPSKRGHKRGVRELKATKTIAIVIGAFVVCWFPFFIIVLISLWCGPKCFSSFVKYPAFSLAIRIPFVYVLPVFNSTMNPIIYGLYNKEFKEAFRKLILLKQRGRGADYFEEYSQYTETMHLRGSTKDSNSNRRVTNMNGSKM